jgi:hypothetical protein
MSLFHSPRIVLDGLVMCLDAANPKSYPGSGTAWADLSNNANNGTLVNNPTFNTENLGSITSNGVNNYITYGNPDLMKVTVNSSFTINVVFKIISPPIRNDTTTAATVIFGRGATAGSHGIGLDSNKDTGIHRIVMGLRATDNTTVSSLYTISLNTIYFITLSYSPSALVSYVNGTEFTNLNTASLSGKTISDSTWETFRNRAVTGGNAQFVEGSIYFASFYDNVLTATEVQQNFNALRGRFGI